MNQRIKELAKQAGEWVAENHQPQEREYHSLIAEHKEACQRYSMWEQKFAELIVRECADVAFLEANSRETQRAVLQHFGVEQ